MFKLKLLISRIEWALLLLFIGLLIRIFYFNHFSVNMFQHDWHGHIEFIHYLSEKWTIPLAGKALEFPQQPLYYYITASIYKTALFWGAIESEALHDIGYFSLFCSAIFLFYAYKFIHLMSESKQVHIIAMVFLALTPSLVYMSARINNDALVMALSPMVLYFMVKSYNQHFKQYFFRALFLLTLLFLTKVSASGLEILFFILLIHRYIQATKSEIAFLQRQLYLFSLVGIFILGFTLLRLYLPLHETFHMVNSGRYPKQTIEALDFSYFFSFHFGELFKQGYAYVFGEDSVRFSFFTYQYGTMIFGEFDYTSFTKRVEYLKMIMQGVLLLGLVYPLGFISGIFRLYHSQIIYKFLFVTLLINVLLVFKFMFDFPSVCNTDFRYYTSSYVLFALFFALGLKQLKHLRLLINGLLLFLALFQISFFIALII